MTCTFPAETGHATIPASLLAMMPSGANGALDINVSHSAKAVVEAWQLDLVAQSNGVSASNTTDGTSSSNSVEYQ